MPIPVIILDDFNIYLDEAIQHGDISVSWASYLHLTIAICQLLLMV